MTAESATAVTGIRTVGVAVTDQERARHFYTHVLGLELRMDRPLGDGLRWIEVAPPGAGTSVALAARPDGAGVGVDTGIRFTVADAAAAHAALVSRGVDVDPEVLHWPGVPAMFTLRDPDGNTLVLLEEG